MMSEAYDTAKKVCIAMAVEHAKRAEYFRSGDVHKCGLKDTVSLQRHHKDVLSGHRQLSWYVPAGILQKTGQDVYAIQVANHKTVERDHTQLLLQEPDCHGRAVTFEVNTDAFDSDNHRDEDEYTTERILFDMLDPSTPGGRLYKVRWKGFAASRDSWEPPSSLVPRYMSVWLDSRPRKSIWISRMCWFTWSWATEIEAIVPYAYFHASTYLHFISLPQ